MFRAVGRPGVVLIGEGTAARVDRLLGQERKRAPASPPSVPITEITVGDGEGQVPIAQGSSTHLRKMRHGAHQARSATVASGWSAGRQRLPIPKGADPKRGRVAAAARQGLR